MGHKQSRQSSELGYTYVPSNSTALYVRGQQRSGSLPVKLPNDKDRTIQWVPVTSDLFENEKVTYVRGGGSFTLFLTESGTLYACGDNDHGQLGIGMGARSDSPLIYKVPTNLKFKHVDCNSYHSLLLSTDDKLYGLGYNSYYQLGTGESADKSSITEVKCIKGTPTSFCCNFSFSTVVTDYKNIYVLGQNWLGTNNNNTNVYEMTLPNPEDKIVHLTGGSFHIMALTESGKLYSAGENSAKLGREREYNAPTWDLVTLTKDKIVTNVCCLGDISVAITIDGTVYLFCSAYGWSTEPTVFTCTRKFPQPKALTCSLYHIMIVSNDGRLWQFRDECQENRALIDKFEFELVDYPKEAQKLPYGYDLGISTGEYASYLFIKPKDTSDDAFMKERMNNTRNNDKFIDIEILQ